MRSDTCWTRSTHAAESAPTAGRKLGEADVRRRLGRVVLQSECVQIGDEQDGVGPALPSTKHVNNGTRDTARRAPSPPLHALSLEVTPQKSRITGAVSRRTHTSEMQRVAGSVRYTAANRRVRNHCGTAATPRPQPRVAAMERQGQQPAWPRPFHGRAVWPARGHR